MSTAILLLGLLPGLLKGIPGISAKVLQLIADVSGSVGALLGSGAISQPSVSTALAAWLGVINVLKADSSLNQTALNALGQLEKAVQAAITEDAVAAKAVDWTQVNPISPVA